MKSNIQLLSNCHRIYTIYQIVFDTKEKQLLDVILFHVYWVLHVSLFLAVFLVFFLTTTFSNEFSNCTCCIQLLEKVCFMCLINYYIPKNSLPKAPISYDGIKIILKMTLNPIIF